MLARPFFVVLALLAGCGGSVEPVPSPVPAASPSTSPSGGSGGRSGGGSDYCQHLVGCERGDEMFTSQEKACIELAGVSCYERTDCGMTFWCQHSDGAECDGYPACDPGWVEVQGCVPDSACQKKTTCGVSIICQEVDPDCEGPIPICDAGDKQISGSLECPQDAKCYTRSNACGATIWCTEGT